MDIDKEANMWFNSMKKQFPQEVKGGVRGVVFIMPADEIGVEGISPLSSHAVFQNTYALAFGGECGMAIYGKIQDHWVTKEKDTSGFSSWIAKYKEDLIIGFGQGEHYGIWTAPKCFKNYYSNISLRKYKGQGPY